MKANDRGKRPDNLTLLVIALAALCVVVLVVVIVLGVTYLGSRDSDDATPTIASLTTLTPTQAPAGTVVPADTPSATLVPSATVETETPTPTATPTYTETPAPADTPSDTPTPTITLTPEPTPDCPYEPGGDFTALWEEYKLKLRCPMYPEPILIQDAEQPFENGRMFWREDLRYIYVVYVQGPLAGTHEVYPDEWEEGDPEYSCAAPLPPPEREQPKRGFGLVWCKLGGADAEIGWALEEEKGFFEGQGDPLVQDFGSGAIFRDSLGTVNGKAYVFFYETGTYVHVSY